MCALAEETTRRVYALKRMRKSAVVQCPEHVFCEQVGRPAYDDTDSARLQKAPTTKQGAIIMPSIRSIALEAASYQCDT